MGEETAQECVDMVLQAINQHNTFVVWPVFEEK
jgi:hypothetical protein